MVVQVQVPHSVIAGKKPLPTEVIVGGLALNLTDYTLYSKGYDDVIVRLTGVVAIENDEDTDATVYLPWVKTVGAGVSQYTSTSKLSFNPATGRLHATSFSGNGADLTGFIAEQIEAALGFAPVEPAGVPLPPEATDLPTALDLLNSIRTLLVSSGMGS